MARSPSTSTPRTHPSRNLPKSSSPSTGPHCGNATRLPGEACPDAARRAGCLSMLTDPQGARARAGRPTLIALSLLCAAVFAVAGCTSPGSMSSAGSAAAATSALRWHSCPAEGAHVQCASLQVPLDYAHPDGRKITLALSEVAATAPASQQQGDL